MDQLQRAVELIKQGHRSEGGRLLMEILRADPRNEQAWLWMAIAVRDPQKKEDSLKRVLALNPGNQQAQKMLARLEDRATPSSVEEQQPAEIEEQQAPPTPPQEEFRKGPFITDEELPSMEQESLPSRERGFSFLTEEQPGEETQQPGLPPQEEEQTISGYQPPKSYLEQPDQNEAVDQEAPPDSGVQPEDRTFGELVQNWTKIFRMNERFFRAELPYANAGDTFLNVLVNTIITVIFFMISGTIQFQAAMQALQSELAMVGQQLPNLGVLFVGLLIGTVLFTPLSFYLSVGLQFLGARIFGGRGKYGQQAYLQSQFLVPVTILSGLITLGSLLPFVGCVLGIVGLALWIWTIILTVRSLKVAHNLSTGRALLAVLAIPLLLIFIGGCILFATGTMLGPLMERIINQQIPIQ